MPLFDHYVAVDWSANNAPKLGPDGIWACIATRAATDVVARNHPTRRAAESWLLAQLVATVEACDRILEGVTLPSALPEWAGSRARRPIVLFSLVMLVLTSVGIALLRSVSASTAVAVVGMPIVAKRRRNRGSPAEGPSYRRLGRFETYLPHTPRGL